MLLGRNIEWEQLNEYYNREGSQIVVVYGQKHIGKTALVKEFTKDKPVNFYVARACSEKEQVYQWSRELGTKDSMRTHTSFDSIFMALTENDAEKSVLVVEEFQNTVKAGPAFMKELITFINREWGNREVLVLLCTSSVGWVENSMLKKIGEAAYELSGLLKIKELRFGDCTAFFPNYTKEQCIETYAVLGGLPGMWACFDDTLTVKENIIQTILKRNGSLCHDGERLLTEELREPAVYNTILASIAEGRHKLNDLHLHTGFSRAKISVYLKNLMELELVEKVFSFDTEGYDNVQKGIYRISNRFTHFYFKFIYPHLSSLEFMDEEAFYTSFIAPELKSYVSEYFIDVCKEHLEELNEEKALPFIYDRAGEWIGKVGTIDIVAQNEENNTLLVHCNYDKPMMPYEEYEKLLYCAKKAKLEAEYVYLYSVGNFDEKLSLEARVKENLTLVSLKEL